MRRLYGGFTFLETMAMALTDLADALVRVLTLGLVKPTWSGRVQYWATARGIERIVR